MSNDDFPGGCGPDSQVVFTAEASNTYWIAVDGHGAATGTFQLYWQSTTPPGG